MSAGSDPLFSVGYWLVNHKATLRTWWGISLLSIILIGSGWAIAFFVLYLQQEGRLDQRFHQSLTRLSSWNPGKLGQPTPLTLSDPILLPQGETRSDLYLTVTNPNTIWAATNMTITCTSDGQTITVDDLFIASKATRPVIALRQPVGSTSQPTCSVQEQSWRRVSAALFLAPTFTTVTKDLRSSIIQVNGQSVPSITVKASIHNASGNNFTLVDVPVVVRSGETVVAVDEVRLDRWQTQTAKELTTAWTTAVTGATSVDLFPQVDQFDPQATF